VRVAGRGGGGARERLTLPPQTGLALAHWFARRGETLGTHAPGPRFVSLDRGRLASSGAVPTPTARPRA
jgi:hypothetical protein